MVLNGFTGPVPLQLSYCLYELHDTVRRGDNARHVHARTVQPSLLYSIASQGGGGRETPYIRDLSSRPHPTPHDTPDERDRWHVACHVRALRAPHRTYTCTLHGCTHTTTGITLKYLTPHTLTHNGGPSAHKPAESRMESSNN